MSVVLNISREGELLLRSAFGDDLSLAAREAFAAEGYRSGRLSRFEVQTLLGLASRWEAEAWLAERKLALHYDENDLEADRRTAEKLK
jgi:hypothetical protein